jgi:hypothetical protein
MTGNKNNFVFFSILAMLLLATISYGQQQVELTATKDNTLIQDPTGAKSDGAGSYFFVGRTNQAGNSVRRGIIAFDVNASIPAGAIIQDVTLSLHVSKASGTGSARNVSLHNVLADWGEGTSDAGANEGSGAPATTSDATWVHRTFNNQLWMTSGGDFSPDASAITSVAGVGKYTWASNAQLVADVQNWVNHPAENFGWLVLGDETTAQTAKRFDSRQNTTAANRPVLTVTYTTATAVSDTKTQPRDFHLDQNYPNPFNSSTVIEFSIPGAAFVQLKLYDLLGQELMTLVNERREAGEHQVHFTADGLTSSVYVYRIQADEFHQTRKLTLLR